MEPELQSVTPPVPIDKHYEVFKAAEDSLKGQLSQFDHYLLLCGLGIGYAPDTGGEEMPALPYNMEFGYLEALDCAMDGPEVELTDEEWDEQTRGELAKHPLPIEYLDKLYEETKSSLEASAGTGLTVGVKIVLYGSPLIGYSVGCLCKKGNQKRKKYCYYDKKNHRTRCYCSSKVC